MSIKFKFNKEKLDELDFIILNDIFKIIKEKIKVTNENTFKIVYNYKYLLNDFSNQQILKTFKNIYDISILVENSPTRFIMTTEISKLSEITLEVTNLKYLKDNFFINI